VHGFEGDTVDVVPLVFFTEVPAMDGGISAADVLYIRTAFGTGPANTIGIGFVVAKEDAFC
jgi:hypothetical protein